MKVAVSTVAASTVAASTVAASTVAASTVAASTVAASTVAASTVAASTVAASTVAASTVAASTVAASTVAASTVAASTVAASTVAASTVAASTVAASTVAASTVAASTVAASTVAASTVAASTVAASTVAASTVAASTVAASTVAASTVAASTVAASTVAASTVAASTVAASTVAASTVAVIGGGAAGFFAAISCKTHHPTAEVALYEKTGKLLSKVKVSGGGRCNVTHACFNPTQLSKSYPRGEKQLKKAFSQFSSQDTVDWFEQRGVALKTEADHRMFPMTNDSQTIIDCLMQETRRLGITICTHTAVEAIVPQNNAFKLTVKGTSLHVDKVIIATGGSPKLTGLQWLADLGHQVATPVPSLFTFNMPGEKITALMGVSVAHAQVRIQGSKQKQEGALLITHWGMSGPAILKLSAWEARGLHAQNYQFKVQVSWTGAMPEQEVQQVLQNTGEEHRKRKLANKNPFELPQRLWLFLLEKAGLQAEAPWGDLGSKSINRLVSTLFNDVYEVSGKTTFKEEFVTCGGVSLQDVSVSNMESRVCPGLYFAGEVLDVDGITGGFNFQAAWTTGYIAGMLR